MDGAAPRVCVVSEGDALRHDLAAAVERAGCAAFPAASVFDAVTLDPLEAYVVTVDDHSAQVDTMTRLRAARPEAKIVLVVPALAPGAARKLLASGTDGVVLTGEATQTLPTALPAVMSGQVVLPRVVRDQFVRPSLSTREKQVLGLVVLGLANGEIAARLFVTESTVKSHLASAFTKLGVRSRAEASAIIMDPEAGLGPGILAISPEASPRRRRR